ncbi:MAG: hypothetical protein U1E17_22610 [Geminicoccaceae bacterium]
MLVRGPGARQGGTRPSLRTKLEHFSAMGNFLRPPRPRGRAAGGAVELARLAGL